jgi:hypothetical protein
MPSGDSKRKIYDNALSSRIKEVFVELHGYSFFHKPSDIGKIDDRFIGRSKIANKLRAILTNNETRSGAYLVTGYRGMGKSSFVSKVIDDIDPSKRRSLRTSVYFRIMVILFLLSLFDLNQHAWIYDWIIWAVIPILIFAIIAGDRCWNDLVTSKYHNKFIKWIDIKLKRIGNALKRIPATLYVSGDLNSEGVFQGQLQILYIALVIHLPFHIFELIPIFKLTFPWLFICYAGVLLILFFLNTFCRFYKESNEAQKIWLTLKESILLPIISLMKIDRHNSQLKIWLILKKNLRELIITIIKILLVIKKIFFFPIIALIKYFNYSKRIYIKINLGYENLKEIDILRLVARNIQKNYESHKKRGFFGFIFKVIVFLLLFVLTGIIYYSIPIYKLNSQLKEKIGITDIMQSQKDVVLRSEDNWKNILLSGMEDERLFFKMVRGIDATVYVAYYNIRNLLIPSSLSLNGIFPFTINKFCIPPLNIDYLFFIYLIFFYLAWKNLIPRLFGLPPDRVLKKKIRDLNEFIDYFVTDESGGEAGFKDKLSLGFFKKKTRKHPRADIREIEKNLISILDDFDKFSRFSMKPEFIFIFDELDKIEPGKSLEEQEKEEGDVEQAETTYFSTEGVRRRQHTIFKILSNLKHFLNTAKGKFIFIAGREMYDAALADVSDRSFFIGSIFHDVIYVNSFLKESSQERPINYIGMTEKYVCQFLFPPYYNLEGDERNLQSYAKYLKEFYKNSKDKEWEKNKRIEKVILTLHHFITFLAYRSNGAPKKITTYFENYIFKPEIGSAEKNSAFDSDRAITIGLSRRNLYLSFEYYDQYKLGMITYLVNPVILSLGKTLKDYGDKLLVSTSFLVNHLYKFHRSAFAWRNVELTPEILDIHKAPHLREIMSSIIHNLGNSDLEEIVNGLYDFKFRKRISDEISFLSKISEDEAAAFNFTLDESLSMKRHYRRVLKRMETKHKEDKHSGKEYDFINSISFINMILGDFHFYDEQYNEALTHYLEAVQYLKGISFDARKAQLFFLMVRNTLKLGLALEKRKTQTTAFLAYSNLVSIIIKFREINLKELGLEEKEISVDELNKPEFIEKFIVEVSPDNQISNNVDAKILVTPRFSDSNDNNKYSRADTSMCQYEEKVTFGDFNSRKDRPVCLSEDFIEMITQKDLPFSSKKEDILSQLSYCERMKIIYQPFLAKLQITEKTHISGISVTDLKRLEREFEYLTKATRPSENFLFTAEFWGKVGNILYFKNGLIPENIKGINNNSNLTDVPYCMRDDDECVVLCTQNEYVNEEVIGQSNISCRACHYYMKSFEILCHEFLGINEYGNRNKRSNRVLGEIYIKLTTNDFSTNDSNAMSIMANTLSCIGDTFYSCSTKFCNLQINFVINYLTLFSDPKVGSMNDDAFKKEFTKMEEVAIYYYLSYRFYLNAGQDKDASNQLLKILCWFRNLCYETNPGIDIDILEAILKKAIQCLYRAYGSIHRLESEDYKEIILKNKKEPNLRNVSINADLREFIGIFLEIKLKWGRKKVIEMEVDEIHQFCFANPYSLINKMYNRIIDLRLKAKINYKLFTELHFDVVLNSVTFEIFFKNYYNDQWKQIIESFANKFGSEEERDVATQLINMIKCSYEKNKKEVNSNKNNIKFNEKFVIMELFPRIIINDDNKNRITKEINNIITGNEEEDERKRIRNIMEFLIADSLFCLREIIKMTKIYGNSYMGSAIPLLHLITNIWPNGANIMMRMLIRLILI